MKTIKLIPVRDFFQTRKHWLRLFRVPVLVALLTLVFLLKSGDKILFDYTSFINIQINVIAILLSFSVTIITILVSAENDHIKQLKNTLTNEEQYKPINGKQLSLFQVLLSNIAYNIEVEIVYLAILIGTTLINTLLPIIVLKFCIAGCIFFIVHILLILLESVAQMYLTFWEARN